jgi:hypothetical protein
MAMEKGHLCKSGIGRIVGFFRGETSLAVHQIGVFRVNPYLILELSGCLLMITSKKL